MKLWHRLHICCLTDGFRTKKLEHEQKIMLVSILSERKREKLTDVVIAVLSAASVVVVRRHTGHTCKYTEIIDGENIFRWKNVLHVPSRNLKIYSENDP